MELELVTIGNELLLGFTVDSNGAEIARLLSDLGVTVARRATVSDDPASIADAVSGGLERTGFVICTGGLGPTRDDITKKTVADLFNAPLELDEAYLEVLRERFAKWRGGQPMPEANRTQAEVPRGAMVLRNKWGTAPGLWLQGTPGEVVMLPGVPREMRGLMKEEVLPRLAERVPADRVTRSRTVRSTGIAESTLADRLANCESALAPLSLAYLPSLEGVDLRLTAWDLPPQQADELLDRGMAWLQAELRDVLYEGNDIAEIIVNQLRARGWTLALAESCTGGMIASRVTAVAGCSDVFLGGAVTYSNASKMNQIGVEEALIEAHGAVSEEVARAMAVGAARAFGADVGLSVTGIAGPGGGSEDKPVGTVHMGLWGPGMDQHLQMVIPGVRNEIRARTAQTALNLLRLQLRS